MEPSLATTRKGVDCFQISWNLSMDSRTESRLLRLAIAKGLLRWEDLDSVADLLPTAGEAPARPPEGRWVQALIASGRLDPEVLLELAGELGAGGDEATPGLSGGSRPPSGPSPTRGWRPPDAPRRGAAAAAAAAEEETAEIPLAPELRFLAGWRRYRVRRFLGAGGMGSVYQAFDPTLDRNTALKFLHKNDDLQTERFLREARAQARIEHPNVCQVYEVGEVEGRPYIAMQYIEGRSLADLRHDLSTVGKVRLLRDVARAIHAAHKSGLIHRDLKPGNVLVGRDDAGDLHPWVVDFGLALDQDQPGLTRTGMISGTPAYLSPEQAQGLPLDGRSDLYSLGVVLYELLAGRTPFDGPNPAGMLVRLLQEEPEPLRRLAPAVPRDLETIAMKCLEKDPARRYGSARELADDLDRYLDGEPIQARPAGLPYRLGKRLRKQRALAAVTTAAAVALLVLGAFLLRSHRQAQERAALAQHFGQRIEALESKMRFEAVLPLHDITPHKREVRRELEEIRREMQRLGPIAEGPGHYALGRAYLALHQDKAARESLARAWSAGGHGPEVAAALGQAFGALYEQEMGLASRGSERQEAARTYGRRALAYLKKASEAETARSPYLAALIAYFENRYPEALVKARQAAAQDPSFFAATSLEARVHAAEARQATDSGRYDEAIRLYDRAGDIYRVLLVRMPSDAMLYAGDCQRRTGRIEAVLAGGSLPEDQVREALATCERALAVDSELGQALVSEADIYGLRGHERSGLGVDPRTDLEHAAALSRRAIALDPKNALAYSRLSIALRGLADWELGRGGDPEATLHASVEAARQAVAVQPERASGHNDLGTAYLKLAEALQQRGRDPRRALALATAACHQAIALSGRLIAAYTNLGSAWKATAEYEAAHGVDPSASLQKAVVALQRAVDLNPNSARFRNNLGNAHLTLGEYLLARGDDARGEFTLAAESYRKATALNPSYALAQENLGYAERSLGQALLARGEDPEPALQLARSAADGALRLNPDDADGFLELGRSDLVAGLWAQRQGRDPGALFARAAEMLRRAAALDSGNPEIFAAQALVERCRAEWEFARGGRPRAAVAAGLARIAKARAINASEARFLALEGALQLLAARLEADPARRAEPQHRAAIALAAALAANPFLAREYGPLLAAAKSAPPAAAR
jgi:eukaryotic-like serine/threonine-protein kinase